MARRLGEPLMLLVGERVVGLVGVRHVCCKAFDLDARESAERVRQRNGLFECDAEAVQPRINFDMDARLFRSRTAAAESAPGRARASAP